MKILLTGATGYIGKRLLPALLHEGHEVTCLVRDAQRFEHHPAWGNVKLLEADLAHAVPEQYQQERFDAAYYLIHSMNASIGGFSDLEATTAVNFKNFVEKSGVKQVIYLTGIISKETDLSKHLESRKNVEDILCESSVPLTAIRAGIIVGSGSASFEIIRDLVEKLPVMITPKWVHSKCQPVGIRNVIQYLTGVLNNPAFIGKSFDIGCGQILSYREMLIGYAKVRGLKRWIFTVPVMTPRLSSYWLYFITSTSYKLAVNLVDSMKIDVIGKPNDVHKTLNIQLIPYKDAVAMAFERISQNQVISSWKDALSSSYEGKKLSAYVEVPTYGCLFDRQKMEISVDQKDEVLRNIWSVGGHRGWYYANWLWKLRGYLDKLAGGVGLRRGRTRPDEIHAGDALDFWRVLVADKEEGRLLLYAEMKLPGEAWLEFKIVPSKGNYTVHQTATFRPDGLLGRLYWYSVLPFHFFIFKGMLKQIISFREKEIPAKATG